MSINKPMKISFLENVQNVQEIHTIFVLEDTDVICSRAEAYKVKSKRIPIF